MMRELYATIAQIAASNCGPLHHRRYIVFTCNMTDARYFPLDITLLLLLEYMILFWTLSRDSNRTGQVSLKTVIPYRNIIPAVTITTPIAALDPLVHSILAMLERDFGTTWTT